MKGQNLRLVDIDNGYCIAGSLSCELHVSIQTENATTNDSEGDFDEFEVTGKEWEIQTEALVFGGLVTEDGGDTSKTKTFDGITYKYVDKRITLPSHGKIMMYGVQNAKHKFALIDIQGNEILAKSSASVLTFEYFNNSNDSVDVYLANYDTSYTHIRCMVFDGDADNISDVLDYFNNEEIFNVALSITSGKKNREIEENVVEGQGFISDIQINSQNRQRPVFTATIKGIGELQ